MVKFFCYMFYIAYVARSDQVEEKCFLEGHVFYCYVNLLSFMASFCLRCYSVIFAIWPAVRVFMILNFRNCYVAPPLPTLGYY